MALTKQMATPSAAPESSSSDDELSWITWFCGLRGNEYFCEVDSEFALDRFNLTGLSHDVPQAQSAYDIIIGEFDPTAEGASAPPPPTAELLFGLIHARYIITPAGFQKMV